MLGADNGWRTVKRYWNCGAVVIVDGRRRWQEFISTEDWQPCYTADTRTAQQRQEDAQCEYVNEQMKI